MGIPHSERKVYRYCVEIVRALPELDRLYSDLFSVPFDEAAFERKLAQFISLLDRVKRWISFIIGVHGICPIEISADGKRALIKVNLRTGHYTYTTYTPLEVHPFIASEIMKVIHMTRKLSLRTKKIIGRYIHAREDLLSPKEAARLLNVSYKTLWRWWKEGKIRAVRLPSGRLKYYRAEIEKIVKESS